MGELDGDGALLNASRYEPDPAIVSTFDFGSLTIFFLGAEAKLWGELDGDGALLNASRYEPDPAIVSAFGLSAMSPFGDIDTGGVLGGGVRFVDVVGCFCEVREGLSSFISLPP